MYKVTVLMSTYNGEKYLEEQINSILNQKKCEVFLLIRDDGSTDKTIKIINKYKDIKNIQLIAGKNIGPASSFMELIKLVSNSSDFYAFSDQDDVWDDDKLYIGISSLLKNRHNKSACYFSNGRLVDENLNSLNRFIFLKTSKDKTINEKFENDICYVGAVGCTMMFNKKFLDILKLKIPNKLVMHDAYLLALCASIDGFIFYDSNAHLKYRQHQSNVIGCKPGIINGLKYRIKVLIKSNSISISDHAKFILENYSSFLTEDRKQFLELVSKYKIDLKSTLKLSFNKKLTFKNFKTSCFIRLSILLRKR